MIIHAFNHTYVLTSGQIHLLIVGVVIELVFWYFIFRLVRRWWRRGRGH